MSGEGSAVQRRVPSVEDLFVRLSGRVYAYAWWQTGDVEAADDITSAVFEKVLRRLDRYDPARAAPEAWVFGIAVNAVRDHGRARRRRRDVSLEAAGDLAAGGAGPEEEILQGERRHRLQKALTCLGPRDREIMVLKLAGRLSNKEIARACGIRPGNVAVIVLRAVRRIRDHISHQEEP